MNEQKEPLVVSFGAGVDSTAMLIEMRRRGIRPDLILFADTGGEKPETYRHIETMQAWCRTVGFPEIEIVRYLPPIAPYTTLEGNCLANETLPSLAFGISRARLSGRSHLSTDIWSHGVRLALPTGR